MHPTRPFRLIRGCRLGKPYWTKKHRLRFGRELPSPISGQERPSPTKLPWGRYTTDYACPSRLRTGGLQTQAPKEVAPHLLAFGKGQPPIARHVPHKIWQELRPIERCLLCCLSRFLPAKASHEQPPAPKEPRQTYCIV